LKKYGRAGNLFLSTGIAVDERLALIWAIWSIASRWAEMAAWANRQLKLRAV